MRLLPFLSRHRIVLTVTLLLWSIPAWGQDSAAHRATLKGVPIVEVVVEAMDPVAERDGLTRSQLQTEVEWRLRQAGITVGPTLTGHLYVNVDTVKGDRRSDQPTISWSNTCKAVILARDPKAPHSPDVDSDEMA
jgi:hypothetical protein